MTAPTLRELQRLFWGFVAGAPERPEDAVPHATLALVVAPTAALAPAERLRIYAEMYALRIRDALREDYPRVVAVLGDAGFEALARAYLAHHPSEHPSLRHLGRHLPAFVGERPPTGAPDWLSDLARLEWARVEAFDAPDAPPLVADDLRVIAPERWPALRFALVPGLAIVRSRWPIHRVWEHPTDAAPDVADTAVRVWREGWTVYHVAMEPEEDDALSRLVRGETFAAACEALRGQSAAEAAAAGAGLLARWLADGLIVGLIAS